METCDLCSVHAIEKNAIHDPYTDMNLCEKHLLEMVKHYTDLIDDLFWIEEDADR